MSQLLIEDSRREARRACASSFVWRVVSTYVRRDGDDDSATRAVRTVPLRLRTRRRPWKRTRDSNAPKHGRGAERVISFLRRVPCVRACAPSPSSCSAQVCLTRAAGRPLADGKSPTPISLPAAIHLMRLRRPRSACPSSAYIYPHCTLLVPNHLAQRPQN